MGLSDAKIDRILGGKDRLAVTEKEAILEQVLGRTLPAPARARPFFLPAWAWGALGLLLLSPVVYLIARPAAPEFTARGGSSGPGFSISCLQADGQVAACAQGGRMVFKLAPSGFMAFAAVAEAPDGTTLWYFPGGERTHGLDLHALVSSGLLQEAIEIGDDHPPGEYVVHGLFSATPLSRDEVREALRDPQRLGAVSVERRTRIEGR
jgi:hypothetical protein